MIPHEVPDQRGCASELIAAFEAMELLGYLSTDVSEAKKCKFELIVGTGLGRLENTTLAFIVRNVGLP